MRRSAGSPAPTEVADRIHHAAIRLLRFVRKEDVAAGVSGAQLSALSVLVFQGAQTLTRLAEAEQVRLPTMSRLIVELEGRGLVARRADPSDRRVSCVSATGKGAALLQEGRKRRLARLARALTRLSPAQLSGLCSAAESILAVTGSD